MNTAFPIQNIIIRNGHVFPLEHCGPLRVMWVCLITLAFISIFMRRYFPLFLLVIKPRQYKL